MADQLRPAGDPRSTRAWRKLRDQVVEDEPECQLQLPGCTFTSVTADHILTITERPDLAFARENLRGVCAECNHLRGRMPDDLLPKQKARRPRALDIFTPLHQLPGARKNYEGGGE